MSERALKDMLKHNLKQLEIAHNNLAYNFAKFDELLESLINEIELIKQDIKELKASI